VSNPAKREEFFSCLGNLLPFDIGGHIYVIGTNMIFTECPYCDEPQTFGWESDMSGGFFSSKCPKCENVMWVEATSIEGTTRTHEDFKKEIMKPVDEDEVDQAKEEAEIHSDIIYE